MTTELAAAPGPDASLALWLDWQLARHPTEIQLGLDRVTSVADRLGLRHAPPLTLTVGGTNGKGAATRLAADLLQASGERVGQFTSPHLHDYTERIVVDGNAVSAPTIVEAFCAIEAVRGDTPLTYFEYGTLAALWVFRASGCTAQVLEVGLGGRLDAVNLLDADAALVTSIGTDHGDWLGTSREAIAVEKAGIFRRDRVAVCAEHAPPANLATHLTESGMAVQQIGDAFSVIESNDDHWQLSGARGQVRRLPRPPQMPGLHQLRNAAGVIVMLDALAPRVTVTDAQIDAALRRWCLPGRFERYGRFVLDVAHNAEAALALVALLPSLPQPVHGVIGMLADKPVVEVFAALAPMLQSAMLVDTAGPRGQPAAVLAQRLAASALPRMPQPEVIGDLATALLQAEGRGGSVLVCGSFMTVGATRAWLAGRETRGG